MIVLPWLPLILNTCCVESLPSVSTTYILHMNADCTIGPWLIWNLNEIKCSSQEKWEITKDSHAQTFSLTWSFPPFVSLDPLYSLTPLLLLSSKLFSILATSQLQVGNPITTGSCSGISDRVNRRNVFMMTKYPNCGKDGRMWERLHLPSWSSLGNFIQSYSQWY